MNITERFIRYTQFDTQSADDSETVPSTAKQWIFARALKAELEAEGLEDVVLDGKGYIYATLPANTTEDVPTIGFISHYDTALDASGANVKAQVVEKYDGGDLHLASGLVTSPSKFPELLRHVGEDLVVTDGTTLLGADDKAGIAEIVQAMCYLRDHPEVKHGKIRVGFNPDEEIGRGAHHFDVERFGCDWAYTMDGGDLGEVEFENFNAAAATVYLRGLSVHTGYAKDKMINAARLACEFQDYFPENEMPETTEGYEGFYHLLSMEGRCEEAKLTYLIRDHDRKRFEERKHFIENVAKQMNDIYGEGTVRCELHDQYYNMKEKVEPVMHVVNTVLDAMKQLDIEPIVRPIRGGTDGAQLSFRGLPCPNIFAGGVNIHGPHEFVSVQVMERAVQLIVRIAELTAQRA